MARYTPPAAASASRLDCTSRGLPISWHLAGWHTRGPQAGTRAEPTLAAAKPSHPPVALAERVGFCVHGVG